ncbi:DUF3108 domain-containing protein [Methylophilus sp. 5]|uniref:DUF3108 domain-containing protein n=1 Tax=Methylophilus sp. 5 TaxID=1112274 RepID=UPI00049028B2|nr:DUF3108 domain-containing protein [Methylophilus sp. 5]
MLLLKRGLSHYRQRVVSVLTAMALLASPLLYAAPKQLTLKYDLLQQGISIGTVKDQLSVTGNRYQIASLAEGKGIYKLMGERTLSSQGQVIASALRPSRFESRQSKHPGKALISEFDWAKKVLNMQIKDEQATDTLTKGTQDLLSVMYCWMWQPPKEKQVNLLVANGKKLALHSFVVTEEATPLKTEAGTFNVIKLSDADGEKTLYLAKDKGYLPVKLVIQDDGKRMEQVITSITGQ